MITAEQIHDEAVEAAAKAALLKHVETYNASADAANYLRFNGGWEDLSEDEKNEWRDEARAAIAAAINAWPGVWQDDLSDAGLTCDEKQYLILPLSAPEETKP